MLRPECQPFTLAQFIPETGTVRQLSSDNCFQIIANRQLPQSGRFEAAGSREQLELITVGYDSGEPGMTGVYQPGQAVRPGYVPAGLPPQARPASRIGRSGQQQWHTVLRLGSAVALAARSTPPNGRKLAHRPAWHPLVHPSALRRLSAARWRPEGPDIEFRILRP